MSKINKNIINYIVLITTIIVGFCCNSDLVKISSILFFLSFISLKEVLSFLERKKIEDDIKKDVEKQIEVLKGELNKINLQFFKMR